MNRRQFHKMALASAASSATLPLGAATSSAPVVASKGTYAFAVAMAKARGEISEALLRAGLKVSEGQARYLMQRLTARGVVQSATTNGVARTIDPMFRLGAAPGQGVHLVNPWAAISQQVRATTARYAREGLKARAH